MSRPVPITVNPKIVSDCGPAAAILLGYLRFHIPDSGQERHGTEWVRRTPRQWAARTGLTESTASSAADQLVEAGLLVSEVLDEGSNRRWLALERPAEPIVRKPKRQEPKERQRTHRDDLFDALCGIDRADPAELTRSQGSHYGRLVTQLDEVGATAQQVTERAMRYRRLHPDWECTAAAVVKHWATLTMSKQTTDGQAWCSTHRVAFSDGSCPRCIEALRSEPDLFEVVPS